VHAATGDISNDTNDSFCEEVAQVFSELPKYHMKILVQAFNVKVGRENISNLTIGNEKLH
jgi:hypothetical protein